MRYVGSTGGGPRGRDSRDLGLKIGLSRVGDGRVKIELQDHPRFIKVESFFAARGGGRSLSRCAQSSPCTSEGPTGGAGGPTSRHHQACARDNINSRVSYIRSIS